jgi:RNA polymerase sigma-70 factor (ECF subfamily)
MDDRCDLPDDANLVVQTLAGNREAFGRLYDRYARLVRAVVLGASRDAQLIQDFTQDVFLRAFRQLATLREPKRFGPWIVGIARRVVRECWRSRRAELSAELDPTANDDTTARLDNADEVEHVLRLVSRLPEQERLAIHLFYLTERNADETAKVLNLSRSGTYAILKRACARLTRWLRVPQQGPGVRP